MVKRICYFLCAVSLMACSKVEAEEQALPEVEGLSSAEMETELPIIEIFAEEAEFARMFENYNDKIRIQATVRIHRPEGRVIDSTDAFLEVRGASSAAYEMKSLGIEFAEDLDNNKVQLIRPKHKLKDDDLSMIKAVRLRNSGNDFGESMIKDLAYSRLAAQADLDLELMYGEPVHAFVNGAYYGMLNMRTESTRDGVSRLWSAKTKDLIRMEVDVDNGNLEYREGNATYAYQVRDAIDLKDAMKLYQMIDISNFIDYIVYQDYIGNRDWPHNNVKAHSLKGQPWRFFLFDLDYAAYNTKNPKIPEMEYEDDDMALLYQQLIKIPGFREQLKRRREEIYKKVDPETFNYIVGQLSEQIEDEIPYLIAKYQKPPNRFFWKMQIDELKHEFERRDYYIRKKYDL